MPWNGSGVYSLPPAFSPEVNGTIIDASRYNGLTTDVATGISAALAKNGENSPTANLPMGGNKHTGAADGTAAGQYLTFGNATASLGNLNVTSATIPANGMYLPATNTLGLASNSLLRWSVNSTGNHVLTLASSGVTLTVNGQVLTNNTVAGAIAKFIGLNTTETSNFELGTDAGDNPNVAYMAMNWTTGAAAFWDFRINGVTSASNWMRVANNGSVSIPAPVSAGDTLTLGIISGSRGLYIAGSLNGAAVQAKLENTSNTASSDSRWTTTVGGVSAGDPYGVFEIPSGTSWAYGVRNSDNDSYQFCLGTVLGSNIRFRLVGGGQALFNSGVYTSTSSQAFTATPTFDASLSNVFEFSSVITANVTSSTITNPIGGQTINIRVKQNGVGGFTFANPTGSKVSGSISTAANAASILTLTYSAMDARWEGAWTQLPP